MDYNSWNTRTVPFFREELVVESSMEKIDALPSIEHFKNAGLYDTTTRNKIIRYLQQAEPIIASTFRRVNAYSGQYNCDLSYYTDGECLFNNMLFEYMEYDDFVLPRRWFDVIQEKHFQCNFSRLPDESFMDSIKKLFDMADLTWGDRSVFSNGVHF